MDRRGGWLPSFESVMAPATTRSSPRNNTTKTKKKHQGGGQQHYDEGETKTAPAPNIMAFLSKTTTTTTTTTTTAGAAASKVEHEDDDDVVVIQTPEDLQLWAAKHQPRCVGELLRRDDASDFSYKQNNRVPTPAQRHFFFFPPPLSLLQILRVLHLNPPPATRTCGGPGLRCRLRIFPQSPLPLASILRVTRVTRHAPPTNQKTKTGTRLTWS